jgi:hypothetical protein
MKVVVALSVLGGLLAISMLGVPDGGAQPIPGLSGPSGAVPSGTPTPPTTSTTIPGRVPAGTVGGAPAGSPAAPSGSVGKTIRLGNPRTRPNAPPEEDAGDMPPAGDDGLAPAPGDDGLAPAPMDGLDQAPEGGGHPDGQEHWAPGQAPQGTVDQPGGADDGDGMEDYEEEWGDDGEGGE